MWVNSYEYREELRWADEDREDFFVKTAKNGFL